MPFPKNEQDQRGDLRISVDFPTLISIGSQLTIHGKLKDISLKSAFIVMKSSIYLQVHDEVGFTLQVCASDPDVVIEGRARISRISVGEGMAIYFTDMDQSSCGRLKKLFK